MFFQHFIECIFHFSSYEKHEKYNRFPQSERSAPPGRSVGRRAASPPGRAGGSSCRWK